MSTQNGYVTASEQSRLIKDRLFNADLLMLLSTLRYWKMHLQSRTLWWKKTMCWLLVSDFLNSSIWPNYSSFWSSSSLIVLNLRKGNTNLHVHDFTFSKKKKNLLPLVTLSLMRQICFSGKFSISKPQHCVATLRYDKQITPTKGTHHRKYLSHFRS